MFVYGRVCIGLRTVLVSGHLEAAFISVRIWDVYVVYVWTVVYLRTRAGSVCLLMGSISGHVWVVFVSGLYL